MIIFRVFAVLSGFILLGCQVDSESHGTAEEMVIRDSVVCYSLLGEPLKYPPETRRSFDEKDSLLQIALENYKQNSSDLGNIIWYGRRLAYLSDYPAAMGVYTRGLHLHPESPELYRHRGHRYISVRRFDEAEADLDRAAVLARGRPVEIEPDGIPNKLNKPLSSLQFNIWYHLGLARYLQGKYAEASEAYDSCLVYSTNDDLLCATVDWYYLTTLRTGDTIRRAELLGRITEDMELIENDAYHRRLLMYMGKLRPDEVVEIDSAVIDNEHVFATLGYGVGRYLEHTGRQPEATSLYNRILESKAWSSFGYIATEADRAMGHWQ